MKKNILWLLFACVMVPVGVSAEVEMSEIMYDVPGTDTGREWIEVLNSGSESVDLSGWKFFENNTNHGLEYVQGNESLGAGEYAVIVDNREKFLLDWPSFSGSLFESSFSLSNIGETLSIKNEEGAVHDTFGYSSELGALGDGKSLQKVNGVWSALEPTPGRASVGGASSTTTLHTSNEATTVATPEAQQIYARIEGSEIAFIGADLFLRGEAFGTEKKPIANARYIWNFGDGGSKEGQTVSHVYRHPGEYVVMLDVSSGHYSSSARLVVQVIPADIVISEVVPGGEGHITLKNDMAVELNLSHWSVRTEKSMFIFPFNSIILPKGTLTLSPKTTGLVPETFAADLIYPNGGIAYHFPSNVFPVTTALRTNTKANVVSAIAPAKTLAVTHTPKKEVVSTTTVVAEVANAATVGTEPGQVRNNSNATNTWIFWLLVLIGGGIAASIYFRKSSKDDITIVE